MRHPKHWPEGRVTENSIKLLMLLISRLEANQLTLHNLDAACGTIEIEDAQHNHFSICIEQIGGTKE